MSTLIPAVFIAPFVFLRGNWDGYSSPLTIVLMFVVFALLSAPFCYKFSGSVQLTGLYVNLISSIIAMTYTFYDGGYFSTAIIWIPIIPLFAIFYSGMVYGLIIALLLFLYLVFLFFAHEAGAIPAVVLDEPQLRLLYFISTSAVTAILLTLALLYVRWQKQVQSDLLIANRAKDDFLSGISHELRTPLNSILGFSEVLKKGYVGELTEKQAKYVEYINLSGTHLLELVKGLLDIGKIESGKFKLELTSINMDQFFNLTIALFQEKLKKKRISLEHVIDASLKDMDVQLDETKMRQVLMNLLDNAIKFTPPDGQILLTAQTTNEQLLIEVADSGPGISSEYHDKIFERFFQINETSDIKETGTGLGLAISRHFIEMHGGHISVESDSAEPGTRFICEIPLLSTSA